jgi:PDZ domain
MRRLAAIVAVFALPIVCGFPAGVALAKDPALLSLSMEHFRDTATVVNEPLDAKLTISTQNGFVEHSGPLHMVWHDEFLTADIDKKTGEKSLQVHAEISYGGSWRFYESASFQSANGPRSAPTIHISKEAVNCSVGDCLYTEHVAFPIDEESLRQLATAHMPAKPVMWTYKLVPKSGPTYAAALSSAEITGFLAKVDEYSDASARLGARPARAPGGLDLGIGGLPVTATEDHPARGGILIIAVNRGSVAQKSGIIVGDILYEFNGRKITALDGLAAAVAACQVDSAVPIKLYRGTDSIAMTAQF